MATRALPAGDQPEEVRFMNVKAVQKTDTVTFKSESVTVRRMWAQAVSLLILGPPLLVAFE